MLKKNLLNLFLVIVVGGLIYLVVHTQPENNLLPTLTTIQADTITQIIIQHNKHTSKLIKQNYHNKSSGWQFTQPVNVAANNFRIKSLLQLLNAPVHAKYARTRFKLDRIGLANPASSIQFNQQLISFGIINPVNHLRYILYNNYVYLIQDVYFPLINSNFSTLVALELLPRNSNIKKLVLLNQTITKNSHGLWKSTRKEPTDIIINTLQHWKILQAFGVHQYLPRLSLGEIQVYLEAKKSPLTFQITTIKPWVILARPALNLEYHLDKSAYKLLLKPTG